MTDFVQKQITLAVAQTLNTVQVSWGGFRGLRFGLLSSASANQWPRVPLETISGSDGLLSVEVPRAEQASFYRLEVTEEP